MRAVVRYVGLFVFVVVTLALLGFLLYAIFGQRQTGTPVALETPSASAASSSSAAAMRRPQGFALPSDCQYVDNGTVDGSAATWKITCPQGLPSNYLRPSFSAQGWTSCGTKVWQQSGVQIAVTDAVNVTGFSGWLDQRPVSGSACVQPTPPPNSGASGPP